MISIVIPNLNGEIFLPSCLKSIERQSYEDFEIIVVDNGSSDDSQKICVGFNNVKFIELKSNLGFSAAVNRGIKESIGEIVFLLNNDTELDTNCLLNIKNFFDKHENIDIMATKMLYFNERNIINDTGDVFSIYGLAHQRGKGEVDINQFGVCERVFGACAGAAAYRKNVFKEVGLFDEDFFAYLEDIDFSFRANLLKKESWYNPDAIVYHVDGGTSKKMGTLSFFLNYRNAIFVILKNIPTLVLLRISPFLFLGQVRMVLAGIKHKRIKIIFKIYLQIIKDFPKLLKKRKKIQRERLIKNNDLFFLLLKKYPFNIIKSLLK